MPDCTEQDEGNHACRGDVVDIWDIKVYEREQDLRKQAKANGQAQKDKEAATKGVDWVKWFIVCTFRIKELNLFKIRIWTSEFSRKIIGQGNSESFFEINQWFNGPDQ